MVRSSKFKSLCVTNCPNFHLKGTLLYGKCTSFAKSQKEVKTGSRGRHFLTFPDLTELFRQAGKWSKMVRSSLSLNGDLQNFRVAVFGPQWTQPHKNLHWFHFLPNFLLANIFFAMGVPHGGVPLNKVWHPYVIKLFYPQLDFDHFCWSYSQIYQKISVFSKVGWENSNFGEILTQKSQNYQILAKNCPKTNYVLK